MSDKIIIIPDVHGRDYWREPVNEYPEESFIFLGDYLDPYPSEEITDDDAIKGLKDIIQLKKERPDGVTLLWGNHDLHYLYPEMMGSRYDILNAERNAHLFWDNQTLFQMALEVEAGGKRFLFSHAGVGRRWMLDNFPKLDEKEITAELMNNVVGYPPFMSALADVSKSRGGDKEYGSMIWSHYSEHLKEENRLPGVVQVFGHTQLEGPFNFENLFYCLDCRQPFLLDLASGEIYLL